MEAGGDAKGFQPTEKLQVPTTQATLLSASDSTEPTPAPQPYDTDCFHNDDFVRITADEPSTTSGTSPAQPSGWNLIQRTRTLWRNLGLSIITYFNASKDEPPKVLIQSSRWIALSRCAIHILPAAVSITLVGLNLFGFFIGSELDGGGPAGDDLKQSILQIAAKIQELLVVASMTAIIFHVLRKELTLGDGLPLGLLVSGWSFASISYFWSPEFWGGVQCSETVTHRQRTRRYFIAFLVFVGGLLALIAGPAAAVLMIPRMVSEQFGGGIFWLNGTAADIYPQRLNSEYLADFDCSNETLQFSDKRCPSSGFLPLFHHYDSGWSDINRAFTFELRDPHLRKAVFNVPTQRYEANTWAQTAHAPTAIMQDAMRSLHTGGLHYLAENWPDARPRPMSLTWADNIRFETLTRAPLVRASCGHQGEWDLNSDEMSLKFLDFTAWDEYWDNGGLEPLDAAAAGNVEIDVADTIRRHLTSRGVLRDEPNPFNNNTFGGSNSALAIPIDVWDQTGSSYAVVWLFGETWVLEDPVSGVLPSNVVVCTVDAGWAEARMFMDHTIHNQLAHDFDTGRVRNMVSTELAFSGDGMGAIKYTPPKNDSLRRIHIEPSWHDVLSPVIPSETPEGLHWLPPAEANHTAIETLLATFFDPLRSETKNLELLVATYVADGLSRSGLIQNHNSSRFLDAWGFDTGWGVADESLARTMVRKGEPVESFREPELLRDGTFMRFEMKAVYTGWMMYASSWFDYLCIVALLTHAIIAFVHSIMIFYTGGTSGAWDSVLEMIALAQVSTPPDRPLLANTSAGIESWKTTKVMAWVEASDGGKEPGQELQLRMRGALELRDNDLKPVADLAYGSGQSQGGFAYRRVKTMV